MVYMGALYTEGTLASQAVEYVEQVWREMGEVGQLLQGLGQGAKGIVAASDKMKQYKENVAAVMFKAGQLI